MADILGKLGAGLKTTLKEAAEQTQKSVDQVSHRTDLLNRKNELKKLYEKLGAIQYKAYMEKNEALEQKEELYDCITKVRKDIARIEEELEAILTVQKNSFSNYKKNVKSTWDDMIKPDEKEEDIEILKICPVCQTVNHEHAAYCVKCGNKFE